MLCRDSQTMTLCELEFADTYVVVRLRKVEEERKYRIELGSVPEMVFDETIGRLTISLRDGVLEIIPQGGEDLDSVSRILAVVAALRDISVLDRVVALLEVFGDIASGVIELIASLQEVDARGGIDWTKISKVAERVGETVNALASKVPSFHGESVRLLMGSVGNRYVKEVLRNARVVLAHAYDASRSGLAEAVPGTCPEVLLDLVLLYVFASAVSSKKIPISERGTKSLSEASAAALARYAKVFGVRENHVAKVRELMLSTTNVREFTAGVMSVLRESLAGRSAEKQVI